MKFTVQKADSTIVAVQKKKVSLSFKIDIYQQVVKSPRERVDNY